LYFNTRTTELCTRLQYLNEKGGFGLGIQSGLITVLVLVAIVVGLVLAWAVWKLVKTLENLAHQVDSSLRQFEKTAEEVRVTNAVVKELVSHAEKGVANIEHVTEGVRKLRKTLDAATGVLDFAVLPVLGTMAGVLAGSKAGMSHVVKRIFRKEGRHGE
jgi:predicted PurR-regulated permease PerM